jgi:TetR/AcrR family transcriptional regulator
VKESKAEQIIKTAQNLFGLYGFEKTSMQEIAESLQISKGSLYYYFPDKENLYKSVVEKEQSEFLRILEKDLQNIQDPADCLRKYTFTRLSYFKALLNLSRIRTELLTEWHPVIASTFGEFREKEKKIVIRILEKGKNSGQFNYVDSYETATLFLDLLRGLRNTVLNNKKLLVIDESEFLELTDRVNAFTEIFIKGLKQKDSK